MKPQTKKTEIATSPHKRFQEIAKILINGICRLESKEKPQNPYFPLDNNYFPSTHGTHINNLKQDNRL
jgi:hypothetical protein